MKNKLLRSTILLLYFGLNIYELILARSFLLLCLNKTEGEAVDWLDIIFCFIFFLDIIIIEAVLIRRLVIFLRGSNSAP